jgi:hypothetical protein
MNMNPQFKRNLNKATATVTGAIVVGIMVIIGVVALVQ